MNRRIAVVMLALALSTRTSVAQEGAPLALPAGDQTVAESPAEPPAEAPAEAPAETPAEAPAEAPAAAPAEAPAAAPAESPAEPPPSAPAPAEASPAAPSTPSAQTANLPPDVPEKHWGAGAVRTVLKGNLMELQGGRFNGSSPATRRDLAMVIGELLARAGKTAGATKLPDVAPTDPAAKAIGIAAGSGALRIKKGGKLNGHHALQREDIALSFSRVLAVIRGEKEGPVAKPVDLNDLPPDSPLFTPVQRVLAAKIISLVNLKYEGYLPINRFQLAAVAVKALEATKR